MSPRTIAVVTAGLSQPSTSRLLADRLAAATVRAAASSPDLGTDPSEFRWNHAKIHPENSGGGGDGRVEVRVIEVRDHARDVANHLVSGFPSPALKTALDTVAGADGVIAVAPTFRASISGLFKSFVDVLDENALAGKPMLLGATGGSARHSLVLEHALRPVFTYMHAVCVPTSVFAATDDWAGPETARLHARIERAAREFAFEIERRGPVVAADPFQLTTSFDRLLASE
ncbi:MAG TPA: FMN reductase [Micromonosporaceae bacterium]|jgi:FMN reductase